MATCLRFTLATQNIWSGLVQEALTSQMKNFADRPSSDAKLPTNDFQVVSKARS